MYFRFKRTRLMRLFKTIVFATLLFSISSIISAQEYHLKISAKDRLEQQVIKTLVYKNKFNTEKALFLEFQNFQEDLKRKGYFYYTYTTKKNKNTYLYNLSLQNKIDTIILTDSISTIELPIEDLEKYLLKKSNVQENRGNSFSEIQLQNIATKNNILVAKLTTTKTKTRTINKTLVKGYVNFPKSFIKNYLSVNTNTIPSNMTLSNISSKIEVLPFISQTKDPSFLFSRDSTLLYLYLKKKKSSYFDGLINLSTNEISKKIELIGYLDLKLENTLNGGEVFKLKWEKLKNRSENFNLHTSIPYLFNSKLSADGSFEIFKQDTSFVTTSIQASLRYTVGTKTSIGASFETNNSTNTSTNSIENLENFNSHFYGLFYHYRIPKKTTFFSDNTFSVIIHPSYGVRNSDTNKNKQLKLETELVYLWELNRRNGLLLSGKYKHLASDNTLTNEFFRIGGEGTIRGINPQSISTPSFGVITSEYYYKTTEKSSIYAMLDLGNYSVDKKRKTAQGFGLGYKQYITNNLITISYSLGKTENSTLRFDNSFLAIKIVSFL